jgi:2-phospho-L-lactate/phosphoenolpyruvate guanylyltransferase
MPPGRRPRSAVAWTVVIPVKGAPAAKSRLGPEVDDDARVVLARAFALDTITAALGATSVARVIVVGEDPAVARAVGAEFVREGAGAAAAAADAGTPDAAGDARAPVTADAPSGGRGLLAAIGQGVAAARAQTPAAVAVLLGDLPGLRPEELDRALEAAARHPLAFVRDADGTGSTLATASDGVAFEPRFGPDSAARHVAAGFVELAASDLPGLTRDVDTVDGLETVLHHGVGEHTAEAVARLADRKGTA